MGPEYHITFTIYNGGPGTIGTSYNVDEHFWGMMLDAIHEHFSIGKAPKDPAPEKKED